MSELERHFDYLREMVEVARAAPLSRRKAMTAALLADAMADRLNPGGDVLDFRTGLAGESEALRLVFALASNEVGVQLLIEPVEVPLAHYPHLPTADFMVSLYNDRQVQRVRIAEGDARYDVHEVLAAALAALEPHLPH